MFLSIDNRTINSAYIKEITREYIIVANTEMVSAAVAGQYPTREREVKLDSKIFITNEIYESIIEQLSYPSKIQRLTEEKQQLKQEVERLKLELLYRPGGAGYCAAKSDFDIFKSYENCE